MLPRWGSLMFPKGGTIISIINRGYTYPREVIHGKYGE
ncbi:hypothetical protein NTHI1209_01313 [Haemophilus influenzae]|uniref:Uncharacterized protein n=1 Tax=Haemophilus influenzae TaxID=727 RepID=A0A158SXW1_HAEIF|nr:hypothetical protein NTHI1209_01313 [Haemophilus influenzae]